MNDLFLLYDGLPFLGIPFKLSGFLVRDARSTANEDDTRLIAVFNLNESKHKNVRISTNEALNS